MTKLSILFATMLIMFTICLFIYPMGCAPLAILAAMTLVMLTDEGKEKHRAEMTAFLSQYYQEAMDNMILEPEKQIDSDQLEHMNIDELCRLYKQAKLTT